MNDPLRAQQMVRHQVRRRRRRRRLRVAGLTVVATAVVVAAAFGIDRLAVAVHRFYDEHHHSHPSALGVTHGSTTTTSTTVPGPARCDSPGLSAVVSDWRETGGAVEENVELTNISTTACALSGYPVLGAVAGNGTPLPAANSDVASISTSGVATTTSGGATTTAPVATTAPVGTTAPVAPVTLAQGARASFQLSFGDTCDLVLQPGQPTTGAPNECYGAVWLEVTPPRGTSPLLVVQPVHLSYATSGFRVGPFQAGDGAPLPG